MEEIRQAACRILENADLVEATGSRKGRTHIISAMKAAVVTAGFAAVIASAAPAHAQGYPAYGQAQPGYGQAQPGYGQPQGYYGARPAYGAQPGYPQQAYGGQPGYGAPPPAYPPNTGVGGAITSYFRVQTPLGVGIHWSAQGTTPYAPPAGAYARPMLSPLDTQMSQQAEMRSYGAPLGQLVTWMNPQTGNSGSITPYREGRAPDGAPCREMRASLTIGGVTHTGFAAACRDRAGQWHVHQQHASADPQGHHFAEITNTTEETRAHGVG
jgi:hypothetical protein